MPQKNANANRTDRASRVNAPRGQGGVDPRRALPRDPRRSPSPSRDPRRQPPPPRDPRRAAPQLHRSAPVRSRQSRRTRRVYRRPIYTHLAFWLVAGTLIIVIVLLTRGCDTGSIDAGGGGTSLPTPSASQEESAASVPSVPVVASRPTDVSTPTGSDMPSSEDGSEPPVGTYYKNYRFGAGSHRIGIDIPAGTADITVLSGTGSIACSNGSIAYAAFGEPYTSEARGVNLVDGASLTVTGSLSLKFSYTVEPTISRMQPPNKYKLYTLAGAQDSDCTYTVGIDLDPGSYDITALIGGGTVMTSDAAVNATVGMGGEQTVKNVTLNEGVTVTVRGCTVNLSRVIQEE